MRITLLLLLLRSTIFAFLATIAYSDTPQFVDPVTQGKIQALSMLRGDEYTAARNDFLANAPTLPDYPDGAPEQDPRYRVQYMILQGWQQNARLYGEFEEILSEVNVDFMSISAAGFYPLYNQFRNRSEREWRRAGLPYAWEALLKFESTRPNWQIVSNMMMIRGYPHGDSIDPLLLSLQSSMQKESAPFARVLLREMPLDALNARLNSTAPFYVKMRAELQEAILGR